MESLKLEGDIGGGLILERRIYMSQENPNIFGVDSALVARNVGAGSGGFSRLFIYIYIYIHAIFFLIYHWLTFIFS